MKNYLGLDVSPLRIGAALVKADKDACELVWHDVNILESENWITPGDRATAMEDLREKYADFYPDHIGLEAVYVGPNKVGAVRAAMALGQIESICDYEWPDATQKILTATQWRSLAGIEQRGKAPVMGWAVRFAEDCGLAKPENQDAADAIAIAYATWKWDLQSDGTE